MNVLSLAAVALGDQIERFGSYFGYAAVIGLGVLSLLYFAQAREVKRLREWAGRAPERDAELAQRVQADAQRRVVAQPQAPAAVAQPASPQTVAAQQADAARKAAAAAVMQKFQPPGTPGAAPPIVGPPGQLARPVVPGQPAGAPAAGAPVPGPGSVPGSPVAQPGSVPGSPVPQPGSNVPGAAPAGAPALPAAGSTTAAPAPAPAPRAAAAAERRQRGRRGGRPPGRDRRAQSGRDQRRRLARLPAADGHAAAPAAQLHTVLLRRRPRAARASR